MTVHVRTWRTWYTCMFVRCLQVRACSAMILYVGVYMYTYIHVYYTYTCTYTCILYIYMYIYMYMYMYIIHIHVHIHVYYTYTCTWLYMYLIHPTFFCFVREIQTEYKPISAHTTCSNTVAQRICTCTNNCPWCSMKIYIFIKNLIVLWALTPEPKHPSVPRHFEQVTFDTQK